VNKCIVFVASSREDI